MGGGHYHYHPRHSPASALWAEPCRNSNRELLRRNCHLRLPLHASALFPSRSPEFGNYGWYPPCNSVTGSTYRRRRYWYGHVTTGQTFVLDQSRCSIDDLGEWLDGFVWFL